MDGSSRFAAAVKYLTQSTWSHAALCIRTPVTQAVVDELLEAVVVEGVRTVPLGLYWDHHTRICRPVGLRGDEIDNVVTMALKRLGHQYDLKNIFDLARYLIQTPPVAVRWRRRMLAFGSGDPTRAICSSLIVQAFQSVHYPVLPVTDPGQTSDEVLHIKTS